MPHVSPEQTAVDRPVAGSHARPRRSTSDPNNNNQTHFATGEKKGACFVAGRGSPFLVSGELFLRSTRDLLFSDDLVVSREHKTDADDTSPTSGSATSATSATATVDTTATSHPSAGLLSGLSRDIRDLLLCHPDLRANEGTCCAYDLTEEVQGRRENPHGLSDLVARARRERRTVRLERIGHLKTSKAIAGCMAARRSSVAQKAVEEFRRECTERRMRLDARLASLILRFAAAVSAEIAEEDAKTVAVGNHCREETERLDLAARLASLAATAEHRTRGNVVLRRLPPTHPQHARCLRAATENVKPGFFSTDSPYCRVRVLDIYKIENRFLLERFQRAAEVTDPCKVKGLFCHVPDNGLEHIVLHGMSAGAPDGGGGGGGGGRTVDTKAATDQYGWDGDPIDPIWACIRTGVGDRAARGGGATNSSSKRTTNTDCVRSSNPLGFPAAFSRYGTLEEEREYANRDDRRNGTRDRLSATALPHCSQQGRSVGEGPSGGQGRVRVSGLRFLALCRVMIGSMHVSPSVSTRRTASRGVHPPEGEGVVPSHDFSKRGTPDRATATIASLPCPPPGQAEFDSVYFPREEEYLLLKEAFVLPEFLVVHRFVGGSQMMPSSVRSSSPHGSSSSPGGTALSDGSQHVFPGRKEAERAADVWRERHSGGSPREQHSRGSPRAAGIPPSRAQNAASVVAGVQAAMKCVQPVLPMPGGAAPFLAVGETLTCSVSSSGVGGASSFTPNGSDVDAVAGKPDGGSEPETGRAKRDSIVSAVKLELERAWLELDSLREVEKRKSWIV